VWRKVPAGHSSCAFQWAALWPLIGVALAQDRADEASAHASALLESTQQPMPDGLAVVVENAIEAHQEGDAEWARTCLGKAMELAQETGYL